MNKQSRARAKRNMRIRLTLVYTLMVAAVLLLVAGMYLAIQGYRFNRYEGQLEQGGLVQFNSIPGNATVYLDGTQLGLRTQGKLTLSAGNHTIAMQKEGYSTWKKDVQVVPGQVLWLSYVRLVPTAPVTDTPLHFAGVASSLESFDSKKLAVVQDAGAAALTLVHLDESTPKATPYSIPGDTYTAPASGESQSFQLAKWAYDNQYVLIKHIYGSKTEWLSINTGSQGTVKNVTALLGIDATQVEYSKDDANTLFVLDSAGDVRKVNVDSKTISGPLAQNVSEFSLYDSSTVAYATKAASDGTRTAAYVTVGAKKPRVIAQYTAADGAPLLVRINKYFGSYYYVVATGDKVRVFTGDLSASDADKPAALTAYTSFSVKGGAQYVGFSPDEHRFVYAQSGSAIATFDLDLKAPGELTFASAQDKPVEWIDQFHFAASQNGTLTMYDYDGTNGRALAAQTVQGLAALLPNDRYLYTLQTGQTGVALLRIKMTTD